MSYDFTTYSDDFDLLPEDERVSYMLDVLRETNIDEQQGDVILTHLNKISDKRFAYFFSRFCIENVRAEKESNCNLIISLIKKRVNYLARVV